MLNVRPITPIALLPQIRGVRLMRRILPLEFVVHLLMDVPIGRDCSGSEGGWDMVGSGTGMWSGIMTDG